jgi:hypothetical protein
LWKTLKVMAILPNSRIKKACGCTIAINTGFSVLFETSAGTRRRCFWLFKRQKCRGTIHRYWVRFDLHS